METRDTKTRKMTHYERTRTLVRSLKRRMGERERETKIRKNGGYKTWGGKGDRKTRQNKTKNREMRRKNRLDTRMRETKMAKKKRRTLT